MSREAQGLSAGRRILALVLPELLCELAQQRQLAQQRELVPRRESTQQRELTQRRELAPQRVLAQRRVLAASRADVGARAGWAVVLRSVSAGSSELEVTERLAAVDEEARKRGLRKGQTVAEARAEARGVRIAAVSQESRAQALLAIAEVASRFGNSVSLLGSGEGAAHEGAAHDGETVWLDVSGAGELFGGEQALLDDLRERVRLLGHESRAAIAPGPVWAQAWARFGPRASMSLQAEEIARSLDQLPLLALPMLAARASWFAQLGLLTLDQLRELPPAALAARLGSSAGRLLELLRGEDPAPLEPLTFPRELEESQSWDEGSVDRSVLLFVLHGLLARLSARLEARGEALGRLEIELVRELDSSTRGSRTVSLIFDSPVPLWREGDLERLVHSRLERFESGAPLVGVRSLASRLAPRSERQLGLSTEERSSQDFESGMPLLIAELEADVGERQVGLLEWVDHARPEARSRLKRWSLAATARKKKPISSGAPAIRELDRITRLFQPALELSVALQLGNQFVWAQRLFVIEKLRPSERLAGVEWWTEQSTDREYWWAWLSTESREHGVEALLYVEPRTGRRFLQGIRD